MSSKRILILGAGRYNVPSIRAAREAGFFTVVADRKADAPGLTAADKPLAIDLNDCDSLIEAIHQLGGIDGVVSMAEVGVRAAPAFPPAWACLQSPSNRLLTPRAKLSCGAAGKVSSITRQNLKSPPPWSKQSTQSAS